MKTPWQKYSGVACSYYSAPFTVQRSDVTSRGITYLFSFVPGISFAHALVFRTEEFTKIKTKKYILKGNEGNDKLDPRCPRLRVFLLGLKAANPMIALS